MIQDGIDYWLGYCKATEPGPDVECRICDGDAWSKHTVYNTGNGCCLVTGMADAAARHGYQYRQPIKLQLQAGESYYMRNGEVVDDVIFYADQDPEYPYLSPSKGMSWTIDGIRHLERDDLKATDLVERIPKQKEAKMNEKMITVKSLTMLPSNNPDGPWQVTISEAERLGEEAKRIREEDKIKAGDFVMAFGHIRKVKSVIDGRCCFLILSATVHIDEIKCTKITNPAHIKALAEIYEAMK